MEKLTQEDRVLNHLLKYGSITSLESFKEYGITRLSAVIFNLKEQNYQFQDEWVTLLNRFGDKVTFKKYVLVKEG